MVGFWFSVLVLLGYCVYCDFVGFFCFGVVGGLIGFRCFVVVLPGDCGLVWVVLCCVGLLG